MLQTNRIFSQRIETSLHTVTHLDGPMHGTGGGLDIASLRRELLLRKKDQYFRRSSVDAGRLRSDPRPPVRGGLARGDRPGR